MSTSTPPRASDGASTQTFDKSLTKSTDESSPREGPIAKAIEAKTSRLPSDTFLWAAGGAIAASLALQVLNQKERSNFVGQWAPTFLLLGLYNKMVKQHGSEGK